MLYAELRRAPHDVTITVTSLASEDFKRASLMPKSSVADLAPAPGRTYKNIPAYG